MRKTVLIIFSLGYLSIIFFFAFRPFKPICGLRYAGVPLEYGNDAVHIRTGAALEERLNASNLRQAITQSGQMSLAILLRTDSLDQSSPAQIVAYARDCMNLNFALLQKGNGLSFILRTSSPDNSGMLYTELLAPKVFRADQWQHIIVTYDGSLLRLFIDGEPCAERSGLPVRRLNWERNHALVIGDEPAGGQPWNGRIRRIAIHDRALNTEEVRQLADKGTGLGAIVCHDFRNETSGSAGGSGRPERLRYRNLFIVCDPMPISWNDCIANIVGFLPLGFLIYMALPPRLERRKAIAVFLIPALAGLLVSGSIEYVQRYILMRVPNVLDMVYNLTGSLLGSLSAWLVHSKYVKRLFEGSR